jgi:hypothetical protein
MANRKQRGGSKLLCHVGVQNDAAVANALVLVEIARLLSLYQQASSDRLSGVTRIAIGVKIVDLGRALSLRALPEGAADRLEADRPDTVG